MPGAAASSTQRSRSVEHAVPVQLVVGRVSHLVEIHGPGADEVQEDAEAGEELAGDRVEHPEPLLVPPRPHRQPPLRDRHLDQVLQRRRHEDGGEPRARDLHARRSLHLQSDPFEEIKISSQALLADGWVTLGNSETPRKK